MNFKTVKGVIIHSGKQTNNFTITKDCIRKMYESGIELGTPLLTGRNQQIAGTLKRIWLEERDDVLCIVGEFLCADNEKLDINKDKFMSYEISYDNKNFDENNRVMNKCNLDNICLIDNDGTYECNIEDVT